MKAKTSQLLFSYWNELRAGRLAPRRFEVEPSAIATILPDTFILERENRHQYIFRLAGTRFCDHFGREFRGRNLLDLWTTEDREVAIGLLESVTRDGGVGLMGFLAQGPDGPVASFEMLLLPLVHTGQAITRVLGSMAPLPPLPRDGYGAIIQLGLNTFEVVWPDGRPHAVVARTQAPAPFLRDTGTSRLVRSDRRAFRVYDGGRKDAAPGTRPPGSK